MEQERGAWLEQREEKNDEGKEKKQHKREKKIPNKENTPKVYIIFLV